jgi:spore maturation protein CgeB
VRYWEIPAHKVMLLAERPPIRIPHNFKDGESAVFFDDLPELEAKVDYYLSRPDEARQIAEEGHRHFMRYHTTCARARQFLGYLEAHLNW